MGLRTCLLYESESQGSYAIEDDSYSYTYSEGEVRKVENTSIDDGERITYLLANATVTYNNEESTQYFENINATIAQDKGKKYLYIDGQLVRGVDTYKITYNQEGKLEIRNELDK